MSNDGNVLPQAEIDVIFKQATGKNISPLPVAKATASEVPPRSSASPATPATRPPQKAESAVTNSVPVQTASPTLSDDALKTIQATLEDLTHRITQVETSISRLSQNEGKAADNSDTIQRLSQRLEATVENLQKINSQVGGVLRGLQGTPGYSIRNNFTCKSCGSHSSVAIPMRCTECGEEGWWGWWPKEV